MAHRSRGRARGVLVGMSGVALAVALTVGQSFGSGVARADTSTDCSGPGRVFLVGGTWDSAGDSVVGIKQRYQGTPPAAPVPPEDQYTTEVIDYPASIWPLGSFGFDDSQAQGEEAVLAAVAQYQADCGTDKKVVIAGYSQGAGIVGDTLTDIGNGTTGEYTIDKTNVSGEVYSDPRQAGTLWGRGIELVLVGVIPGLTMAGSRTDSDYGGLPVTTYCIAGDPICDLPDLLHDPIGALDGLLGYWVKHGLYPYYMYLPTGASWNMYGTDEPSTCTAGTGASSNVTTCVVSSPSSTAILTQQFVDALGIDWSVPDLLPYRFTLPDIFGITLADFQPPIRWVMGWFPQLPDLGYGGTLASAYAFQNIIQGVFTLQPQMFIAGVRELATSAASIVLIPVNAGGYWLYRVAGVEPNPFPGPAYRPSWEALKEWIASLGPQTATQTTVTTQASRQALAAPAPMSALADETASRGSEPAEAPAPESQPASAVVPSDPTTDAVTPPASTDPVDAGAPAAPGGAAVDSVAGDGGSGGAGTGDTGSGGAGSGDAGSGDENPVVTDTPTTPTANDGAHDDGAPSGDQGGTEAPNTDAPSSSDTSGTTSDTAGTPSDGTGEKKSDTTGATQSGGVTSATTGGGTSPSA
ncbi:PE-PPE domain-containing protein [Gordonia sp. NPDC003424]